MAETIAIYSAEQAADGYSLELAQSPLPAGSGYADMADIVTMYRYAASGRSARTYQPGDCPMSVDGEEVTLTLGLYVFPTDMDLGYDIQAMPGEVGEPVLTSLEREFDLVIPMANFAEIGFLSESFELLDSTLFYNARGGVIPAPEMEVVGTTLQLSSLCFAVLRLRAIARCYRHDIEITVTKQAGYKVENFAASAQATWMSGGELQSTDLDLDIPACVESYLAHCEETDGELISTLDRAGDGEEKQPVVYYNQCTGEVIEVRYE